MADTSDQLLKNNPDTTGNPLAGQGWNASDKVPPKNLAGTDQVLAGSPLEIDSTEVALLDDDKSLFARLRKAAASREKLGKAMPDAEAPRYVPPNAGYTQFAPNTGRPVEVVKPTGPSAADIIKERNNTKLMYSASEAQAAFKTAEKLGLPVVAYFHYSGDLNNNNNDDDDEEGGGRRPPQDPTGGLATSFKKLAGEKVNNGKVDANSLHGNAVFIEINVCDRISRPNRNAIAEAKKEYGQAQAVAKSIGIQEFANIQDPIKLSEDRRNPRPMVKGMPRWAVYDPSTRKWNEFRPVETSQYNQPRTLSLTELKAKIPAPIPADKVGK